MPRFGGAWERRFSFAFSVAVLKHTGRATAPCTSFARPTMDDNLESLHTGAGVLRGQPLEIGLVLQHFHCGRYMRRTARADTGLQREKQFFTAIGLQLAVLLG